MKKNNKVTHMVTAHNGVTSTSQGAYGKADLYALLRYFFKDGYISITIKKL